MIAVFKREFRSYFTSPVGYVVLSLIFALSGVYFYIYNILSYSADLTYVFENVHTFLMILVLPVLTMRLFSEEKRQKTDQALLTAPVSLTGVVLGKYLAALALFAIGISIMLVMALVIALQVTPDWVIILGNYVGLLLLGGMVIAVGLLISTLTESQFIAALGTFLASFLMLMVDTLAAAFVGDWITDIVAFLSVNIRYGNFTDGWIRYDDIVFFLSMQALFLFLAVRVLDRKRWN
jgi:ABC-2 type transport system permease protein